MVGQQNKRWRWGIIGCGNVTEVKSGPAYQQTPGFALQGVMRRNLALAQDYAQRHQVPLFFADADELIQHPEIDAVYIATPPDSHRDYALRVAEVGKPCCIEKPLAPSYRDSQAIVSAFSQAKLPLFVAYYRRSLPRFAKVRALLQQGAIGQARHLHWQLCKPPSEQDISGDYNWRTDKEIAAGGYFDDLASHGLDLFAWLLGDYAEVQGVVANQQGLYSAWDAVSACWRHYGGVTGSASWNFASYRRQDRVWIEGSAGNLSFSIFDEAPISLEASEGVQHIEIANPRHIQQYHVQAMATQLAGGTAHPSNGQSALHTSWVMDRILRDI